MQQLNLLLESCCISMQIASDVEDFHMLFKSWNHFLVVVSRPNYTNVRALLLMWNLNLAMLSSDGDCILSFMWTYSKGKGYNSPEKSSFHWPSILWMVDEYITESWRMASVTPDPQLPCQGRIHGLKSWRGGGESWRARWTRRLEGEVWGGMSRSHRRRGLGSGLCPLPRFLFWFLSSK